MTLDDLLRIVRQEAEDCRRAITKGHSRVAYWAARRAARLAFQLDPGLRG